MLLLCVLIKFINFNYARVFAINYALMGYKSTHDARLMSSPPVVTQTELAKFQATFMLKILKHLLWCVSHPLSQTPAESSQIRSLFCLMSVHIKVLIRTCKVN